MPDYDKSAVDTEVAQIDKLIEIKKYEIEDLEELKKEVKKGVAVDTYQTPAETAQDPDADEEARVAAANAVLGQSPEKVNAEQQIPSPTTHDDFGADDPKDDSQDDSKEEDKKSDDSDKAADAEADKKGEEKDDSDKSKKASTKKS